MEIIVRLYTPIHDHSPYGCKEMFISLNEYVMCSTYEKLKKDGEKIIDGKLANYNKQLLGEYFDILQFDSTLTIYVDGEKVGFKSLNSDLDGECQISHTGYIAFDKDNNLKGVFSKKKNAEKALPALPNSTSQY